jgi:hypothetical protein
MDRFNLIVTVVVDAGRGAGICFLLGYVASVVLYILGIVRDNGYDGNVAAACTFAFAWLGGTLAFAVSLVREVLQARNGERGDPVFHTRKDNG